MLTIIITIIVNITILGIDILILKLLKIQKISFLMFAQ